MGARCEHIVALAFSAFLRGSVERMAQIAELDERIDRDELEIHALIMRVLALRQPVAADLRFLAVALRLITDLERIGDEAVNIAERAPVGCGGATGAVDAELRQMAEAGQDMLHLALDAFIREDDELASGILKRDDEVDHACALVIDTMTAWISEHPSEARSGLCVIRVAKFLERIADHATNIAEEDIFMVRGDDVRHGGWQQAEP
jgi:phosphate transport system protein